ncbi:FLYWCH zinc finger domain-containing protein [Ditylenchus destructor]|uniref:FLYWCH zinc finger domain-containing protein n=1 Tax=Ditylenchus destructor TaxID=166010 RepID=A0AAD4R5R0_9BILA|nr:FLYWCH zinc finger domain-containing protein [Ditylenchus destructor]
MSYFIKGQRGSKLVHLGHMYNKQKQSIGVTFWYCENKRHGVCNGRAKTEKIKAEETKLALRNTASTSSDNTRAVVSNTLVGVSPCTLVSLPKFSALDKLVQRKRKADNPMPIKIPHTIQEIPDPLPQYLCLTKTSNPQPFVLFDSANKAVQPNLTADGGARAPRMHANRFLAGCDAEGATSR